MKQYQAPEIHQLTFVAEQEIAGITLGSIIHNDVELAW